MQRRTALQFLPSALAITASPEQLLSIARRVHESVFTPESANDKLLVALVDCILPATSTPSASEVGVPAFIQLALNELVASDVKQKFYEQLEQFDFQCRVERGNGFDALSKETQEHHLGRLMERNDAFCMQLKQLTLTAYFTSHRGMTEALNYNPIPGSYNPCVQVTEATKTEASYF